MVDRSINFNLEIIKDSILNFVVPLIALGISVAVGFFIGYPSLTSIKETKAQIETQTKQADLLAAKKANLDKLVDFKTVVDENSNLINKILISEEKAPELLDQIDQMVRSSGLTVERLSYSSSGPQKPDSAPAGVEGGDSASAPAPVKAVEPTIIGISLVAGGNYDQLINFFEKIEKAARIVTIENFRYGIQDDETTELLSISLSIESPYLFVQSSAITDEKVDLDISDTKFIQFMNKIKLFDYYQPETQVATVDVPVIVEETAFGAEDSDLDETADEDVVITEAEDTTPPPAQ